MINFIPPGLILIIAGFLLLIVPKQLFRIIAYIAPLLPYLLSYKSQMVFHLKGNFLDYSIEVIEGDKLSRLFGLIFSIMALGGTIFSIKSILKIKSLVLHLFMLVVQSE